MVFGGGVFGGGILGGARKIWGNPYLNSTTVLFDTAVCQKSLLGLKRKRKKN